MKRLLLSAVLLSSMGAYAQVGINTTEPRKTLDVNGDVIIGDNDWSSLSIDGKGDNDWMLNAHSDGESLHIRTKKDGEGEGSLYHTTFKRDGKIGIGVTSPEATLDINGDLKVSSNKGRLSQKDVLTVLENGKVGIDIKDFESDSRDEAKLQVNGLIQTRTLRSTNVENPDKIVVVDRNGVLKSTSASKFAKTTSLEALENRITALENKESTPTPTPAPVRNFTKRVVAWSSAGLELNGNYGSQFTLSNCQSHQYEGEGKEYDGVYIRSNFRIDNACTRVITNHNGVILREESASAYFKYKSTKEPKDVVRYRAPVRISNGEDCTEAYIREVGFDISCHKE